MTGPLITTDELARDLAGRHVVDATWYMPGEGRTGAQSYAEGHIPGAVFFDIDAVSDHASDLPHMLPTPQDFAEAAGALGLTRDRSIVVYDAQGLFSAPRVWWTLRVMGFPDVRVLDGGLRKWRAEGRPIETRAPSPAVRRTSADYDPALVRNLDAVKALVADGGAQLVDARAAGRFRGEAPEPRAGLRSGHMPGARNVPWAALVREDGTLKSAEELRAAFEAGGVDLSSPIVTTCGSGVSAPLLALALARLGRFDVPVYDGSWTEWASRDDTPIVTGA